MKILFVTLEQSARENIKVVLNNNFFQNNIKNFYTFGMPDEDLVFKDLTNIKIKSLMGLVDISKNLPYLFSLRNSLNLLEKENNFTHIFFVDSFDFSKFYLKKYRNNSIKYCQFIGPSVFIWKKNKAKFINKYFDHIFSIFEVERKFYKKEKYSYIGHPLLNNVVLDNRDKYPIRNIGIFLGSRYQEIIYNIPIITQLLNNLEKLDNFNFYFFVTKEFEDLIKNSFTNDKYQFYLNDREYYNHLSKLDFAFACSGTVHLELSFSHIPHFIFYKANWLNYLIFRIFVRSKYLSLVNIFNKRSSIKEFIQSNFNHYLILKEFKYLFVNKDKFCSYSNLMIEALNKSNIRKIRSEVVIDYLKKSSLTKED
ncbi:Lipid-A-disaccharide synthetase [alpha proteobacterium HIMB59]|nr:Lipid-A-disaccharide synthetase [alpha proteobacterium HIMB59]